MATTRLNIGQATPAPNTLTDLFTCVNPTIIFQIVCCNRSTLAAKVRIAHSLLGAAITDAAYLEYDLLVPGNQSLTWDQGRLAMRATDVLRVQSDNGLVSFNAYGEVTS